jgi:hypothetical protein
MAPPQLLNGLLSLERSLGQLLRPAQEKIEENEGTRLRSEAPT